MKFKYLLIATVAVGLSGCISVKSYVDPKYDDLSYANVSIPQDTAFDLSTEFQTKGKVKKSGSKQMKKIADKLFAKANIANTPDGAKLKITCNNIGDVGGAAAKGFATGLTLGLAGSTVTDGYEFTFELQDANGTTTKTYQHALHSTVGNAKAPIENVEAVTPLAGFEAVFEDVLLNFLKDMNAENKIAWNGSVWNLAP